MYTQAIEKLEQILIGNIRQAKDKVRGVVELIKKIISNVLIALYQPFWFAVLSAVLFMFLIMYAEEHGWKASFKDWKEKMIKSSFYRKMFILVFYFMMILFRTLLNRNMWLNPVSDVIGVWGFYNEKGEFTTEIIENMVLCIPFTLLLLWSFQEKIIGSPVKVIRILRKSTMIVFGLSLTIELLQLFLRLGTFQLSDLFYNTLGGLIGGLIYWLGYKITHRKNRKKDIKENQNREN